MASSGSNFAFSIQMSLSLSVDGSDTPVDTSEDLERFLKFLQRNRDLISGFFWKNFDSVCVSDFQRPPDDDEIVCCAHASSNLGFERLYKDVASDELSKHLTTVLNCNGLSHAVGSTGDGETHIVTLDISKKVFNKGIRYFNDQTQRTIPPVQSKPKVFGNATAQGKGGVGLNALQDTVPETITAVKERPTGGSSYTTHLEVETQLQGQNTTAQVTTSSKVGMVGDGARSKQPHEQTTLQNSKTNMSSQDPRRQDDKEHQVSLPSAGSRGGGKGLQTHNQSADKQMSVENEPPSLQTADKSNRGKKEAQGRVQSTNKTEHTKNETQTDSYGKKKKKKGQGPPPKRVSDSSKEDVKANLPRGDHYQTIKKRFSVFIPDSILKKFGNTPSRVVITITPEQRYIPDIDFTHSRDDENIWNSPEIDLYLDTTKDTSYEYIVFYKKGTGKGVIDAITHMSTQAYYNDIKLTESFPRKLMVDCSVHRDTFRFVKFSQWVFDEASKVAFFTHVVSMSNEVTMGSLKEFLRQLETLYMPYKMGDYNVKRDFMHMLNYMYPRASQAHDHAQRLFFLASLSMFCFYSADVIYNNLKPEMAHVMLQSLNQISPTDLIDSRIKPIKELLSYLLKSTLGQNAVWEMSLPYVFPFLSVPEAKSLQNFFYGTSATIKFTHLEQTFAHLCRLLPENNGAEELLVHIIKQSRSITSIAMLIEIDTYLAKFNFPPDQQTRILSVIHQAYIGMLQLQRSEPKNVEEEQAVVGQWKFILGKIDLVTMELAHSALALRTLPLLLKIGSIILEKQWIDEYRKPDFVSTLSGNAVTLLDRGLGNQKCVFDLQTLWEHFKHSPFNLDLKTGGKVTRTKIRQFFQYSWSWKPSQNDLDALESLLLDETVFLSQEDRDFITVMEYIADSKEKGIRQIFKQVLDRLETLGKDLGKAVQSWYNREMSSIKQRKGPISGKLGLLYDLYFELLGTSCLKSDEVFCKSLDDKVREDVSSFGLEVLCNQISHVEKMSDRTQEMFEKHFSTIIMKSSSLRSSSCLKFDTILVSSRIRLVEINAVLKFHKVPDFKNILDSSLSKVLVAVLKDSEFWYKIFSAQGSYSREVKEHVNTQKAYRCLDVVAKGFTSLSMPVYIASKLSPYFRECDQESMIRLMNHLSGASRFNETLQVLEQSVSNAQNIARCLRVFNDSFLSMVDSEVVDDKLTFSSMLVEIEERLRKDDRCFLAHINDKKGFWGPFLEMVEQVELLEKLRKSNVFLNLCRHSVSETDLTLIHTGSSLLFKEQPSEPVHESSSAMNISELFENNDSASEDEQLPTASGSPKVYVSDVAHFLTTDVYSKFKSCVQPFFVGDDVFVSEVIRVFEKRHPDEKIENEIGSIETLCQQKFMTNSRNALLNFEQFKNFKSLADNIMTLLKNFSLEIPDEDELHLALNSVLHCTEQHDITLMQIGRSVQCIKDLQIDNKCDAVLYELTGSKNLISFLEENQDEDFRNLIDAVEEHSDSFVRDAQVSQLIEVKRFLAPFIRIKKEGLDGKHLVEFLEVFKKACNQSPKDIVTKINGCNEHFHALKTLHSSVANRGEMTKGIITNIMQGGKFSFCIQPAGDCHVIVSYKKKHETRRYSFQDLSDLKSRALLIINKDSVSSEDASDAKSIKVKQSLAEFIETFDVVHTIIQTSTALHREGHFDFRQYKKKVTSRYDLERISSDLVTELDEWAIRLKDARKKFYLLNYVYSDQLWTLFDYFKDNKNLDSATSILRFINSKVTTEVMPNTAPEITNDELQFVGDQLHALCGDLPVVARPLDVADDGCLSDTITKGVPFIVHLQSSEISVVKTVLKIYGSLTSRYPQPHQILFCSPYTQWDEISLLLSRCVAAKAEEGLFCLTNVELLPNDIQFALADEIREIIENSTTYGTPDFLLCILCKGSSSHPILAQFSKLIQRVQPMTGAEIEQCLQTLCPDTFTVTSSVPGLGKSEVISETAQELHKKIVHFPISGPFDKSDIITRLQSEKINAQTLLHLDVAEVDDPYQLDIFIFELIVLGMVSSGTNRFVLETKFICIEIGNSLKAWLRNSLSTSTCFKRVNVEWNNYINYIVSREITSPVQVVCGYLDAHEKTTIDSIDIHFGGPSSAKPLSDERCQQLLQRHFSKGDSMSFAVVEVFLNVLADQLKKLSASQFFQTYMLQGMVGAKSNVKSTLVEEMVDVFKTFASRSVKSYREAQADVIDLLKSSSLIMTASSMVDRVEGMIRWADSNHLLVIFHSQDFNTVSALYRDCERVPEQVSDLFNTQIKHTMPDFSKVDRNFLQNELEKIVRTSHIPLEATDDYALTPDNLLKMVLIFLRIKANVPVLIMGETGCGKTSLITYLAKTADCSLEIFNIHAGIQVQAILNRVRAVNNEAIANRNQQYWLFLDEINTCDHLGLINEMLCHRTILGQSVAPNLVFLAACNPYKARGDDEIMTTGLEGKVKTDTRSNLVYRVHPLPEAMIDYVWDYGSLDRKDEISYISRMVHEVFADDSEMLVELLSSSQDYIREYESTSWCVSLRDVKRCISLCEWFQTYYLKKKSEADEEEFELNKKTQIKAIVLALAHCYNSRLATTPTREMYCEKMAGIFMKHGHPLNCNALKQVIRKEQVDLLNRMDLPDSTAKNTALRENVFVILMCILNKIPIFVVGKPGCSKSLSVQLIKSNLRGPDSRNSFFQLLPQMYIVSYQGSESSTSEGIIKVFDKAKRYKENNSEEDVLPVVLLDEIGLAEQSTLNPLKVLHSLLEPEGGKSPEVAVVGISNWALDAAKMNRAIHLSRPEPDELELFDTAVSISTVVREDNSLNYVHSRKSRIEEKRLSDDELRAVSKAYFQYQKNQNQRNFHGLRDYYSLIKYLCNKSSGNVDVEQWRRGLLRNFGGLKFETLTIVNNFLSHLQEDSDPLRADRDSFQESITDKAMRSVVIPVKDLVQENVNDKSARHLMLITHGVSALGILENFINLQNREHEIIFGSRFDEDLSEDYNYRVLSKIILCMERGVILILKDLENIYGSLYDMLNQNYTVVGSRKRKNCRIALGPYSNPMCFVHDDFRCVVLVDMNKVDYSDPPFLNRFEKQLLTFKDVLSVDQKVVIDELERWVAEMCEIPDLTDTFSVSSTVMGYSSDLLPSLVLKLWPDSETSSEILDEEEKLGILKHCQETLMLIFSPDGMLRSSRSVLAMENREEIGYWQRYYFDLPIHSGLRHFVDTVLSDVSIKEAHDGNGFKVVVQTRSNILYDVEEALQGKYACQVEKLSIFKSEKQLTSRICQFWSDDDKQCLVMQCKPSLDSQHMLLAKSLIDKYRSEYIQGKDKSTKHVIIGVHLDREEVDGWQFNFLSGWNLVNIDSLEEPETGLTSLLGKDIVAIMKDETLFDINRSIEENMFWAFSCIKYSGTPRSTGQVIQLIGNVKTTGLVHLIARRILQWMTVHYGYEADDKFSKDCWQVKLACDSYALYNSLTVVDAFTNHLHGKIREPLALIVFLLEDHGAWISYKSYPELWTEIFFNPVLFCLDRLPLYREVEFYKMSGVCLDLSFPFSKVFVDAISDVKESFLKGYEKLMEDPENQTDECELSPDIYLTHQSRIADVLLEAVPQLRRFLNDHDCCDFLDDFCDLVTAEHVISLDKRERISVARWAANLYQEDFERSSTEQVVQLVTNYWVQNSMVQNIIRLASVCKDVAEIDVVKLIAKTKTELPDNDDIANGKENQNLVSENHFSSDCDEFLGKENARGGVELEANVSASDNDAVLDMYAGGDKCERDDTQRETIHAQRFENVETSAEENVKSDEPSVLSNDAHESFTEDLNDTTTDVMVMKENENEATDWSSQVPISYFEDETQPKDINKETADAFIKDNKTADDDAIGKHNETIAISDSTLQDVSDDSDKGGHVDSGSDAFLTQEFEDLETFADEKHHPDEPSDLSTDEHETIKDDVSDTARDSISAKEKEDEKTEKHRQDVIFDLQDEGEPKVIQKESDATPSKGHETVSVDKISKQHEPSAMTTSTLQDASDASDKHERDDSESDTIPTGDEESNSDDNVEQTTLMTNDEHGVFKDHLSHSGRDAMSLNETVSNTEGSDDEDNEEESKADVVDQDKNIGGESDRIFPQEVGQGDEYNDEIGSLSQEGRLVHEACKAMLPTMDVIKKCGSIENWQYKVNLVLSVASKVSLCPGTLYLLRVCNDFVMNIQMPNVLKDNSISILSECAKNDASPLESNALFDNIMVLANELVSANKVSLPDMQKFICLYLGRCFDGKPNCIALELFLNRILKDQILDKDLHYFGAIIDRVWLEEEYGDPDLYKDILDGGDFAEDHPNLHKLGEVIYECFIIGKTQLACLTCDVLDVYFKKQLSGIHKHNLSDAESTEFINCANNACSVLQIEKSVSLRVIFAVAFLKAFLRTAAELLKDTEFFINRDGANTFLHKVSVIFDMLSKATDLNGGKGSVKLFLFKVLREDLSFQQMNVFCNEYTCKIPSLEKIEWMKHDQMNPMGYRVMSSAPDYAVALNALLMLLSGDEEPMTTYVAEAKDSSEKRFALLSIMVDNLYLVAGNRELKDTEKEAGKTISKLLEVFPDYVKDFAKCLTLERKFELPLLNISPESNIRDIELASVVVHLVCMTVCHGVDVEHSKDASSLFAKILLDPLCSRHLYIPSSGDGINNKQAQHVIPTSECACMYKVASSSLVCPICKTAFNKETKPANHVSREKDMAACTAHQGFNIRDNYPNIPRNLSKTAYVILRIFLDSTLVSGHAIANHDLSDVVADDDQVLNHNDALKKTTNDLLTMWSRLEQLLPLQPHQICCFLQVILWQLRPLLCNMKCSFTRPQHKTEWEIIFSEQVDSIITQKHRVVKDFMCRSIFDAESYEAEVDELENPENADRSTTALFRYTPVKSMNILKRVHISSKVQDRHPFLGLVFDNEEHLTVLRFLKPILKWQKLMTSCKSHLIPRKDSSKEISEIIAGKQSTEKERKKLREALSEFIEAWSKLREYISDDLPNLHHESSFKDCVAVNKGSLIFEVIQTLTALQNTFLDKALQMAASEKCVALSFLLRGPSTAALAMMPIHEAASSQIIHCTLKEWEDDLLRLSQFNTTYGMGYDLQLDLTAIEMELSNFLLVDKAYLLLNDSFPFFSYAQELPACIGVLSEIAKSIAQSPIPETAALQLRRLHETSPNNTITLKFNLDIVLNMLLRSRASLELSGTPIVEYADKWYKVMAKDFPIDLLPEPSSILKLTHLCSLYEMLEDLLCHNAEDKLPDMFRQKMNVSYEQEFISHLKTTAADLALVAKYLRRFIYRYFSTSEDQMPDESQSLIVLLEQQIPSSDTSGQTLSQQLAAIFKPFVQMRHVYTAVKRVEEVIKEKANIHDFVRTKVNEKKKPGIKRKRPNFRQT